MLEIFAYRTLAVAHFTDPLKLFIVSGMWWSVKLVLPTETQKLHFCERPWSLHGRPWSLLVFSEQGADNYNDILMSLLLLVAETIIIDLVKIC